MTARPVPQPGEAREEAFEERERGRPSQRRFRAEELFAGTREIIIEHQEADYRLRLTSKGKLILTR
ncbi:MAG: hemin uptake protein HemP [Parvibaculaceae bacterium]